jgi:hypothetical protein
LFSCLEGLITAGRNRGVAPTVPLKRRRQRRPTESTASTAEASAVSAASSISTRVKAISMFFHVADYMISFMWQSCCGERAGSHIEFDQEKKQ